MSLQDGSKAFAEVCGVDMALRKQVPVVVSFYLSACHNLESPERRVRTEELSGSGWHVWGGAGAGAERGQG